MPEIAKLRRTYNDQGVRHPAAATYEMVDPDGDVIGHVCRYDIRHDHKVGRLRTGRVTTYSHWRARLFGRPEGPQRNTRRAAIEAVVSE